MRKVISILVALVMVMCTASMAFATDASAKTAAGEKVKFSAKSGEVAASVVMDSSYNIKAQITDKDGTTVYPKNTTSTMAVDPENAEFSLALTDISGMGITGTKTATHKIGKGATTPGTTGLVNNLTAFKNFKSTTINGKVEDKAFTYKVAADEANYEYTATPASKDAVSAAWSEAVKYIEKSTNPGTSNYVKIPKGAYVQVNTERITVTEDLKVDAANVSLDEVIKNAEITNTTAGDAQIIVYLPNNAELAMGESVATLKEAATVKMNGFDKEKLAEFSFANVKQANGKKATLNATLKSVINPIVNAANEETISVDVNFGVIDVTGVSLGIDLYAGKTQTLRAVFEPETAADKTVTWKSSNTSVVTVNAKGLVTAIGKGNATITATAKNGKQVKCYVTVLANKMSGASISKISNRVYTGKTIKPRISVKYGSRVLKNGTDYTVAYKNNTKTGKVTVTVTARGNFVTGSKSATFKIIPKKAAISKLRAQSRSFKVYIKSQKSSAVTGYRIAYKKGSKGKYKYAITHSTSKTVKKLSRRTKYYVKVRAYKRIDGKRYYGSYSRIKSVRTK